tara:strand:+ start:1658 stop:1861 length:204 start_codon:yes stop_codon:yes gene_type:complete
MSEEMTKFEQELIEVLTDISIQINVLPDKLADAMEYRLRELAEEKANGDDEEYDDEDNKEKKNGWDL